MISEKNKSIFKLIKTHFIKSFLMNKVYLPLFVINN